MKKLLALLLTVVMLFALCACSNSKTPAASQQSAAKAEKVAMITDYGDITDQSFNQTTYEACQSYCTKAGLSFSYFKPADNSTADRVAMIEKAVDEGYTIIVMPGFAFAEATIQAAPLYPNIKFVVLDVAKGDYLEKGVPTKGETYDYNPDNWDLSKYADLSNVYTMIYQEELCGYMAGYATVMMGYTKLGFCGGMAVPAVMRYGYGFLQGANAAAEKQGVTASVKYAYANQFFGDADITAAMDTWYKAGIEAVFACGGGVYTSVTDAAVRAGGKVIGVDVDQAGIINTLGNADMTITSAMKGLASSTMDALKQIVEDNNWDNLKGKIVNLGLVSGTDPEANFVGIPMQSTKWCDSFSQEDYKAMVKAMFDGTIKVSNDVTVAASSFESANLSVEDLGNLK